MPPLPQPRPTARVPRFGFPSALAAFAAFAALALTSACASRDYNVDEAGADAAAFRAAKQGETLSIIALKDTLLKSVAAGTKQASVIPADQKCFVARGTRLRVQKLASPAASNHYRVTFAEPIPARGEAQAGGAASARPSEVAPPGMNLADRESSKEAVTGSALPFESPLSFRIARAPERESFTLDEGGESPEALSLSGTTGGAGTPAFDGAFANATKACPFQDGFVYEPDWDGNVLPPTSRADDMVRRFVEAFRACGGARGSYYQLGGSRCGGGIDCSNSIRMAYARIGVRMAGSQADQDANFTRCTGGVKPGDHLLLAKPGREPDHWVTLVKVNNASVGNSSSNVIVDVSSDCNGLCPVQHVRSNLAPGRRSVYACARLKALDQARRAESGQ